MPETTVDEAIDAMDRLRERIDALRIGSAQGDMRFTFSAGVAAYQPGHTVADTVARADRALYRAKAAGRNRIELEDDEAPRPVSLALCRGQREEPGKATRPDCPVA
jgi:diguanylate cyclase (GGDEF)-like protein